MLTPSMDSEMKFYRYELKHYGSIDEYDNFVNRYSRLELCDYDLIRKTPKGYWIGLKGLSSTYRWVSASARKRFAYPTKEEALVNYIARTKRRIQILKAHLDDAKHGLFLAEDEEQRLARQTKSLEPA